MSLIVKAFHPSPHPLHKYGTWEGLFTCHGTRPSASLVHPSLNLPHLALISGRLPPSRRPRAPHTPKTMVTASNRSSGDAKEDKKASAANPSNGHVSSQCEDGEKDGGDARPPQLHLFLPPLLRLPALGVPTRRSWPFLSLFLSLPVTLTSPKVFDWGPVLPPSPPLPCPLPPPFLTLLSCILFSLKGIGSFCHHSFLVTIITSLRYYLGALICPFLLPVIFLFLSLSFPQDIRSHSSYSSSFFLPFKLNQSLWCLLGSSLCPFPAFFFIPHKVFWVPFSQFHLFSFHNILLGSCIVPSFPSPP